MYKSDEIIKNNYYIYKTYVNKERGTASLQDGLKPVQRRILYSIWEIAKRNFVKSATVVGHVMGRYHPHAESYGTLVNLVRSGFVIGKGNFGITYGLSEEPPAAMRYTEVKMNPLMLDLAYKFMDEIPYQEAEIPGFQEPFILPVMFPLSIVGLTKYSRNEIGIGVGLRSVYPIIKLTELVDLVLMIIDKSVKKKRIIHGYYGDISVSMPLRQSNFFIEYQSKYDINNKQVIISALAPNLSSRLSSRFPNTYIRDESSSDTKIIIDFPRRVSIPENLNELLTTKIKYQLNVFDIKSNKVISTTIFDWVLYVLKQYINFTKHNLLHQKEKIEKDIYQLDLIIKHMKLILKYIAGKDVSLPEELSFINQKTVNWIRTVNLKETRKSLEKELKIVNGKIKDMRNVVYSTYQEVSKLI